MAAGGTGGVAVAGGTGGTDSGGGTDSSGGTDNAGGTDAAGGTGNSGGLDGCADALRIFALPAAQGGCGDSACHVAGATPPDLVSEGVGERLFGAPSSCNSRPFIGSDDSFLAEKISGVGRPECGEAMPFFQPGSLGDEDRQCLLDWIDSVAAGGGG